MSIANSSHTLLLQCRGSPTIQELEERIRAYDPSPDLTRRELFIRSIGYAAEHSFKDSDHVKKLAHQLKNFKQQIDVQKYPSSISISLAGSEEERVTYVISTIKQALGLSSVRTQYLVELAFYTYYLGMAQQPVVEVSAENAAEKPQQPKDSSYVEKKLALIADFVTLIQEADQLLVERLAVIIGQLKVKGEK